MLFIFFLGLTAIFVNIVPLGESMPLKDDLKMFPQRIGHWIGRDILPGEYSAGLETLPNVDDFLYRRYQNKSGENVFLYIGYSGKFKHDENIFLGSYVARSYDWKLFKKSEESRMINENKIKIKRVVFKRGRQCYPISYWYQTNRGVVTDRDKGRLFRAFDAILNRRTNVALIRLSSDVQRSENCTFSVEQDDLIEAILPHLGRFFPFEF